ncbi:PIN domain-containing protein [Rhodopseudomonas sp. P2A-2r]|uniref:PIN domain-containing protein n=1 Tax=Rhodopseudomonas sp. P2A-2r TaxID=2991972 RepID=UPI0022340E5D|nr:PIN domain-containing protein [Rhodopseudomonas sp. P2A-2r]UZE49053.1 PIN domain-containing protein [Rhodopseudomonas sp. P2A-2r]
MIVAFDASVLTFIVDENAGAPTDPATGNPVTFCKERVQYLLDTLQKDGSKIIIPTPSLAEVLVKAGNAAPKIVSELSTSKHFKVVDFDVRAAVEFASRQIARQKGIEKRTKAKFDDQILAIAIVENASVIYSDDKKLAAAAPANISVVGIADLPLPPAKDQHEMFKDDGHYADNPDYGRWG